jgi:succinyl-diaminopimelate desuccinylase
MTAPLVLDLTADAVTLTRRLVDIESVSRNEQAIADLVEAALRALPHLTVVRRGHTVVARTSLGRPSRVVLAGHLDTVPVNDNLPSRLEDGILHGLGTCDMKGGDAVILRLAAAVTEPVHDLTFVLYEAEEIDSQFNGLRLLSESDPDLLTADFAVLWRQGARARFASTSALTASAPTPPAAGAGSMRSTPRPTCSTGCRRTTLASP